MKVIITTSGTGSRLGDFTKYTNKSLVNVGDKYTIDFILENYKNIEISENGMGADVNMNITETTTEDPNIQRTNTSSTTSTTTSSSTTSNGSETTFNEESTTTTTSSNNGINKKTF